MGIIPKPILNQPNEFQDKDAQRTTVREHSRDPQNSFVSLKMGNGISIGLMSGTSMDGIDAVIMQTNGQDQIKTLAKATLKYPKLFQLNLREAELKVRKAKANVASPKIIKESTEFHAQLVKDLLRKANFQAQDVDVIGYHGQSLYHNPKERITIQIGDGQLLANLTGITVINDFRSNDIANGGQGAPLAPLYHYALAKQSGQLPVAIINCGGIANITLINDENNFCGFDTGPGNVLLDRYIREGTNNNEFMDLDGKYSSQGQVNQMVLQKLSERIKPYLDLTLPKSLDPGDLTLIPEIYDLSINDACATLANFTAKCIVESVKTNICIKWILAGGGWNNPSIRKYLNHYLAAKIENPEIKTATEIGWDSTYMEAEIFAYLAVRSLHKLPITYPNMTGVKTPTKGGKIYTPN